MESSASSSKTPEEESLAPVSFRAPRVDPVTEKENNPISSEIDKNNLSLGEREKSGAHNVCDVFPGLDARNKGKIISNNCFLENRARLSSGTIIRDNSYISSSIPDVNEFGCCYFVGLNSLHGPNGKLMFLLWAF